MAENDLDRGPVSRGGIAPQPLFAVGAVLLGAFLANFDSRLTTVGLPDLRGAFSLGFDEGAWLSTAGIGSQIFIAPAVAWLATVFGLRRVLGIPSLVYALISLVIPFVHDYPTLIVLSIVHGMLLGTFVPATLMIIFRNLPIRWWLPAISIYAIRVGFALDTSTSLVGFYVDHLGWQWLYWQGVVIAPLMGLMVYLGTPNEPVNRDLLRHADWGGMLLLGASVSMIYAGLDQGNRLDWLESGTVMALLLAGGCAVRRLSDQRDAGSPALGACQCAVLAQCRALAGRHPALHADQPVQLVAGAEFPQRCRPDAARTKRRAAADLWRVADVGAGAVLDLPASAFRCARRGGPRLFGVRGRQSVGNATDP